MSKRGDLKKLIRQIRDAMIEGLRMAAAWLAMVMRQLVGVEGGRSKPGEPPHKQTGRGQRSIVSEDIEGGAVVGPLPIGVNVLAGNYMAMWDHEMGRLGVRRPWLATWERYLPQILNIVKAYIQAKVK